MRHAFWFLAAVASLSAWANPVRAQAAAAGGYSDPFFLYYGYYLPRQAALADQPRIQDTINANVAANQANASTNRSNLYDPNGGYGRFDPHSTYDPFDPNTRGARGPGAPQLKMRSGTPTSNMAGQGPALHFNRMSAHYPITRPGQGPNRNVAMAGRGVRRGGTGVPSAGPR